MLADGGEAISDLGVLRDQPELCGSVASTATAWRVLAAVDEPMLAVLRHARAVARERLWLQRQDVGRELPAVTAGGRVLPGLVLDLDASLIDVHSDKESAAANFNSLRRFDQSSSAPRGGVLPWPGAPVTLLSAQTMGSTSRSGHASRRPR